MDLKTVLATLVDALEVDLDLFTTERLEHLRATDFGTAVGEWAQQHPSEWKMALRFLSAATQAMPRGETIVAGTLRDQAARLPADLHRIFGKAPSSPQRGDEAVDEGAGLAVYAVLIRRLQVRLFVHVAQMPEVAQQRFLALWRDIIDDNPERWLLPFYLLRLVEAAIIGSLPSLLERYEQLDAEAFAAEWLKDWTINLNQQFLRERSRIP